MLRDHVGVNVHLAGRDLLQLMASAGFSSIRVDFRWDFYEPQAKGVYTWETMDQVVHDASALNLQICPTLGYTPAWANGGQPCYVPPIYADDWFWAVHTIVSRYKQDIPVWSLWNEPNLPHFYAGTVADYVHRIHEPGVDAIKQANFAAQVCGPELSTEGSWEPWLSAFLRQTGHSMDVITVHSYQDTGREMVRRVVGPQTWLMWIKRQSPVREVILQAGYGHLPLWVTETGFSTAKASEEVQASYYDQIFEAMGHGCGIEKVFFYQTVDEPAHDGQDPVRWGILHEDMSPKPAYHTCQERIGNAARIG